ncbi:MAG: hypothetical protein WB952_19400 [Terriglobales bacterium]
MKRIAPMLLTVLLAGLVHAQTHNPEASVQQKFVSGGTIRLHLEAGGYTISPVDADNIVVTYRTHSESSLKQVKVAIRPGGSNADIVVADTPNNNFTAIIEVPRQSNLWVRLSAGELIVESVEGDKDLELRAGHMQVDIPHPEQYGHCDASVLAGSLEASAFDLSKGGLFRSFERQGPGKYRLHAHVMTGEVDLRGSD